MLLDTFQSEERFWLTTVFGAVDGGLQAFRGDLVVRHGEFKEAAGKRNPPEALLRQSAVLAGEDKLLMVAGNFASVDEIPEFIAQLGDALADDCRLIFFVDNVANDALVDVDGKIYALIQFRGGMVWNELMELLYVEKADLKGMSGEDKVKVLYEASKEFEPSFDKHTLDDVLASKTGAVREAWGAI